MTTNKSIFKILYVLLTCASSRRCGNICHVGLVFLLLFGLYLTTSYYSSGNDKIHPLQEIINETVYTETTIVSYTERTIVTTPRPQLFNETVTVPNNIKIGEILIHCGLPKPCSDNEFSVHIYTGKDHKDEPRLCVDGKYILAKEVNGGGRGINVVVVDNMTRSVIRVSHFDTYEKDSAPLETLLLTLRPGDIIILLTFDEPTRKLSRVAKLLLYELGSALIQNLSYRGSWYLVSQKGISGFSPYEELHIVENNGWPKRHDVHFCIPFQLKGQAVHPDPTTLSNPSRVEFCSGKDNFPLFCDADVVNDPLTPAPVWKQPAAINRIYNVPVLVMSGDDINYLPLTLETLVRQPGVKPSVVVVFYLPKNADVSNLADLFGFISEELTQTSSYCDRVQEAFELANLLFPDAKEVILLGENALLAPDFLYYMGQLLSILITDPSVLAISAWNENGFKDVSGDPSMLYRIESFSSLAITVRRSFFKKGWCKNYSISDPLYISSEIVGESIIPDVSRVTLAGVISNIDSEQSVSSYAFDHDKTISYEQNIPIKNPEKMYREEYEKELESLLTLAVHFSISPTSLLHCSQDTGHFQRKLHEALPRLIGNSTSHFLAIHYLQANNKDVSTLKQISQCLGLFYHPFYPPRGIYKGIIKFMLKDKQAILVGSSSPFNRFKPPHVPVFYSDPSEQTRDIASL